jgi:uncharacterized membrane protein
MVSKENYLKDLMGHVLQVLYMIFLGIIVALFCGLGIDAFYPAPRSPEYPAVLQSQQYKTVPTTTQTAEELAAQKEFDTAQKGYTEKTKSYNRNASLLAISLAVISLILSLTVLVRWEVIANGVLLGGILTMAYSIIIGMSTEDTRFRFLLVTVSVLVTLVLGYIKFIKPNEDK